MSLNLNPEIQTTKFTKQPESQGVPNRVGLVHQVSAKIVTIASSIVRFVTFVVLHFPSKDEGIDLPAVEENAHIRKGAGAERASGSRRGLVGRFGIG